MRATRRSGFTLLELLCVVALLGILLFFVLPKLDSVTPQTRLKSAARRIGSTMELAQGQAIASGKEYVLAYDLGKQSYWLILPPPDDPNALPGAGTAAKPGTTTTATAQSGDPNAQPPPPPDVEHDPKPAVTTPAPSKSGGGTATPVATTPAPSSLSSQNNYQGRETTLQEDLGDDVQMVSVSFPNGQEGTNGIVYVRFSSLGNEGTHSVTLKLKGSSDTTQGGNMSVRFSALTRTVDFGDQKLGWSTIGGP
jgi:prepilin-type N-terminal cleavage/methylation domain-containing protein